MKRRALWTMISIAILFYPAQSMAQQEKPTEPASPFTFSAEVAVGLEHRSNIYLTERDATSDKIWKVAPVAGVQHKISDTSYWSAQYIGDFAIYQDNDDNNWQSHIGSLAGRFGGVLGPYVEFDESYIRSSDPFGSDDLYNEGQKTYRTMNNFHLRGGWKLGQMTRGELRYANLLTEYDLAKDADQNQREQHFGGAVYYGLTARMAALVHYRFVTRAYPDQPEGNNEDFTRQDVFVGVSWDPTARINGEAKVGYSANDYDNTYNKDELKLETADTWVAEANLTYLLTPRLHLLLTVQRQIMESTAYGSNYFIDQSAALGARWWPLTSLTLFAEATFGSNDYNSLDGEPEREDDIFKFRAEAEYSFLEHFFAMVTYLHEDKDSNRADSGYTDDRVYVGIGGRF